ncbi:MAG TPA: ATP-binding protein [Polyangiaceae bacterium]|nr:ATP-binding protein [Polyangiaceae bacterium]
MNIDRRTESPRPQSLLVFMPPPARPGRSRGAAGPEGPPRGRLAGKGGGSGRERRLLRELCEVSKLLLRFEGAERTTSSIFALMVETLALRGAVLLYDDGGQLRSHTWRSEGMNLVGLRLAEMHARRCYAYLAGGGAGPAPGARGVAPFASVALLPAPSPAARAWAGEAEAESTVALPLVVGRGRVFGTLQLTVGGRLDEPSLFFISAVANQLALALDRESTLRAERGRAEEQRRQVERRSMVSETARVRAEQARALAERLCDAYESQFDFSRAVTDSLGEGVVAVDAAARVAFINPAAERLLGWTAGDALGAPVQELLRLQLPEGAFLGPEECPLLVVLHNGEAARGDDVLFLRRDGAPLPVSYTSAPIRRGGRVTGAVLVFRDVIELKRSENAQHFLAEVSAALATSLDYEQTFETAAHLSVPFLADACHLEVFGEGGAAPRAAGADDEIGPGGSRHFALEPRWHDARAVVRKTGRPLLLPDLQAPATWGTTWGAARPRLPHATRLASLMVVPLRARGRLMGLLSLGSLESGRRYAAADLAFAEELAHRAALALDNARSYQAMQRAVRQRQDVLAVVSHDLRTPLGTVLMGATLLPDQCEDPDQGPARRRTLDMITRSVAQMDRLIKDLLDMSSIDAGHLALDRAPHSVDSLIEDTLETLRPLAARKSVQLEARASDEDVSLVCDRWRIVQVLSNLVGNAIKFTPEGGSIVLRTERVGRDVRFFVTDSGPGIDADRLPRVFERYWQANETATKGTGLGLYICKGIVEAHGGRIDVHSEVGRGTTFFFTLPLVPPEAAPAPVVDRGPAPEVESPAHRSSERPAPPSLVWPPVQLPLRR